jgi:putative endopeptidase
LAALSCSVLQAADTPPVDPGFSVAKMDRSVVPGEDFAKFAAGGWYASTKIPADKSRWGGFDELAERNWSHVRAIVQAAAENPGAPGSLTQKVGDFFASALDTERRNQLGLQPIQPLLDRIAAVKDRDELARVAAEMHVALGNPLLNAGTGADEKRSDTYAFYLRQGGTSLPSKEYYFSEKFARERWEFLGHVARMFELAGDAKALAHQRAETVFGLEKALAENSKLPVELREREANYHKMTVEAAAAAYPGFPLRTFMAGLGLPAGVTEVIIGQPKFMEGLSRLLQERSLDEWKVYTRWQLLRSSGSYLSTAFEDERFRFSGTVLNGTPQQEPRWQRAARVLDGSIGEAVGQLYVEKHFPPAAKARMQEMIRNIQAVMRDRLQGLEWMSEATRAKALAKFDRFEPMIGYTDKWRDYSAVEIRREDFFGNVSRAAVANSRRQLDRTGGKVDKREWGMTPQTVNAYFSPTTNQIVFPAGILQPPFFDPSLDDAVNYGAIGCVIGHEITHG